MVHSSLVQQGLNTALNDARRLTKELKRRLEVTVRKLSKKELEMRISEAGSGKYKLVGWSLDGDFGSHKRFVVKCVICEYEWDSDASHLMRGSGCPNCAKFVRGSKRRMPELDVINNINSISGVRFIRWLDEYRGNRSKAVCECDLFHTWSATVNNIIDRLTGCPSCANRGFQLDETGYLYSLRSECGQYIKVGISNDPKRRHKQLEKRTPFKFNLIEQISGDGAKIAALEKYFHNKYERAGFTGFDGCTEWLMCTPQLLEELRELEDVK